MNDNDINSKYIKPLVYYNYSLKDGTAYATYVDMGGSFNIPIYDRMNKVEVLKKIYILDSDQIDGVLVAGKTSNNDHMDQIKCIHKMVELPHNNPLIDQLEINDSMVDIEEIIELEEIVENIRKKGIAGIDIKEIIKDEKKLINK